MRNVMENVNGITNGKAVAATIISDEIGSTTTKKEKQRPANTLTNGRVVTRVWANRKQWGGIQWRVDHYAKNEFAKGGKQFSLELRDLWDAMRGLYQAQRWIKKVERRR